jgi:putative transposase
LCSGIGRPDVRTLTHKGIEYKGLFYNSEELAELRKDEGDKLSVDIRVDEENIGHLYVIWDNARVIEAKALDFEYANSISAWQHKQFQYYRRTHNLPDHPQAGLRQKKMFEISSRRAF